MRFYLKAFSLNGPPRRGITVTHGSRDVNHIEPTVLLVLTYDNELSGLTLDYYSNHP